MRQIEANFFLNRSVLLGENHLKFFYKTISFHRIFKMGLAKAYLVSYNVLQLIGWSILMWRLVPHLTQLKAPTEVLYQNVGGLLRCVQTAAFLEVAHAAFGKNS